MDRCIPCFSIAETDTHAEQDAEQTETHSNYDTSHSMNIQLCRKVIEQKRERSKEEKQTEKERERGEGKKRIHDRSIEIIHQAIVHN